MKELTISAIKEGTVIDHVPAEWAFDIIDVLDLDEMKNTVSIANNLKSRKMGKKCIVKIAGKFLTPEEVNKIAIIAPNATMSIIKDYKVKKKIQLSLPEKVEKIIKCPNPKCITNNEDIKTKFYVLGENPVKLKCHYCERGFDAKEAEIK